MKLSDMIASLQKAQEEYGDREIGTWLDSGEDTIYPARIKNLSFRLIDKSEFDDYNLLDSEEKTLWIDFGDYEEDSDSLIDLKKLLS